MTIDLRALSFARRFGCPRAASGPLTRRRLVVIGCDGLPSMSPNLRRTLPVWGSFVPSVSSQASSRARTHRCPRLDGVNRIGLTGQTALNVSTDNPQWVGLIQSKRCGPKWQIGKIRSWAPLTGKHPPHWPDRPRRPQLPITFDQLRDVAVASAAIGWGWTTFHKVAQAVGPA
ncbi:MULTISPECIES: hypothetical protein [unclassified Bradyrhizobium]|uniref:hypothetical protein n=1 Tax=unclassified Bradyrhizobium TaxID=2631580 RepID=UPI001FF97421|nr:MULTISPECIES: hypothetical protein [unclassified Bradyrhizobium]MCK1424591.1 hypothetical protein [Bradyrhizobium sp. CW12]MCK1646454.1 hypothetical protein [Bradyrhizobium sp. 154]MCK1758749.1 hypothetical protein [Bradyrhizobium sp. 137]